MKNQKEKQQHMNEETVIKNEGMCEIKALLYGPCLTVRQKVLCYDFEKM